MVEALWADICRNFAVWKGVGHFERKFQWERGVPHQRILASENCLGYRMVKKLPKSSTAWVGCTNVTDDRQTDETDRQTDRQTTDGRPIAHSKRNVIRWRLLKMGHVTPTTPIRYIDIARYWSKIADFNLPHLFFAPLWWLHYNFVAIFTVRKLDSLGYCMAMFSWS